MGLAHSDVYKRQDVDISLDMEKHMISLPSSIYGRIIFIAVSIDGAEVFGRTIGISDDYDSLHGKTQH